jgi:hypothetical protein
VALEEGAQALGELCGGRLVLEIFCPG